MSILAEAFTEGREEVREAHKQVRRIRRGRLVAEAHHVSQLINDGLDDSDFLCSEGRCDVLIDVFDRAENVELEFPRDRRFYRSAVVGTPIWLATAPPKPFVVTSGAG